MFEAKIYDAIEDNDFIGVVSVDDEAVAVAEVDVDWDADMIADAVEDNIEEIIDMHNVMKNDPDVEDTMHMEIDLPDTRVISVHVDGEEV